MKILLATDGSDCSAAAVNSVAGHPWPEGSELKIISATDIPDIYYTDERVKARAKTAVNEAAERIKSGKASELEIVTEVKYGDAEEMILDEAKKWGADLIVVGSHGYNRWERFLLGSVSHAVASHAHCSVEIVRQKPLPEK